jgi:dihydrofolate synthase/folylpolyglutamate synthase
MNYRETTDFLFSQLPAYHRIGKAAYKESLENILKFDEYIGHPHLKFKTIHIAGTNGKGSVSHMTASALQEAGYRTGLYTSPHLIDFRERIRVNGEMIPETNVISFVEKNMSFIESLQPSFFEMTVAMAFEYFAMMNVDIAVIEVGLGGRLDSTNIITPVVSVITNIGHDHMDILGDTLQKVAAEKAGIIKNGIPVVVGETQAETKDVFMGFAHEKGSEIRFADQEYSCWLSEMGKRQEFRNYVVKDKSGNQFTGATPLGGDYQAKNIVTVFGIYDILKRTISITTENLANGIRNVIINTDLSGRWQIVASNPLTICDTGHNKEGLEYVLSQLKRFENKKIHFILGFVSDKDLSLVFPLFPTNAEYYFTRASVKRAMDEKVLAEKAREYGLKGNTYANVRSAFEAAKSVARQEDVIFIGGSTFIVADFLGRAGV